MKGERAVRILFFLSAAVLAAGHLAAQTSIHSGPVRAFHTAVGGQTIARDSQGHLYVIYRDQFSPPQNDIAIGRSTDGGKNWDMNWQTGFAANAAGDAGNYSPNLAIDGQGNLHCAWHHQVSTQSRPPRTVRYNRYDAALKTWGSEVTLTATARYEMPAPVLAVDSANHVWIIHGTSGWSCSVQKSDKPNASDLKFSPANPAFTHSGTCQKMDLVIDALDRVHVSFYSTASSASVHHKWMDPAAASPAWSSQISLGNNNGTADYYSTMAADLVGNVYIVCGVDVQNGKTPDPFWELRKWDGQNQTWSSPVPIYKTTRAQYKPGGKDNDGRVISAACDETTGEVYFVYRNYDTGEFLLGRWHDGDAAPTTYARLMNSGTLPPNSLNYFFYPQLRGTLFPTFNRTSVGLDLMYTVGDQTATTPKYTLYYDPFPVGSLSSTGIAKIGTTFALDLSAVRDGGLAYVTALSLSGLTPGLPIDRRIVPIVPDNLFLLTAQNKVPVLFQNFQGVLSKSGSARSRIAIPSLPALVSLNFYAAYLTYPGGPKGVKTISNPFTFTITK